MTTPTPPTLNSIICQTAAPRAILNVVWTPTGDYIEPFTILVQDLLGKPIGSAGGTTFGGTWVAPADMDLTNSYFLVVQTSDPNIATPPTPVLVTQMTNVSTSFDGKTLVLTWNDPPGPRPVQVQPVVRSKGPQQAFAAVDNVNAVSVVPSSFILPASDSWWGEVAPVTGIAKGPFSIPVPLLKNTPAVSALSCTRLANGALEIDLITPDDKSYATAPSFIVNLYADDWPAAPPQIIVAVKQSNNTWLIPYVQGSNWPLPGGVNYRFSLRQVSASATGPEGRRLSLPLAAPQIDTVAYVPGSSSDQLLVTLTPPAGSPFATGARITLFDANGAAQPPAQLSGFAGTIDIPKLSGSAYKMVVATEIGAATGLDSDDNVALILGAPTVQQAQYNDGVLDVSWSAPAGAVAVAPTAYRLTALSQGALIVQGQFGGNSGSLAVPAVPLAIQISALTAQAVGPASVALTLIMDVPPVQSVTFLDDDTAAVTLGTGVTSNRVQYQVMNEGQLLETAILPAATVSIPLKKMLLAPEQSLAIKVRYLSAQDAPQVAGPWCAPVPLLAKLPTAIQASYDGATARISWSAVDSPLVSGYQLTVLADGQVVAPVLTTSSTAISLPLALDRSKTNTVRVQAVAGPWLGKPAAPAALFEAGFYLSTASDQAPHLLPATAMAIAPFDLNLYLPDIFVSSPTDLPDTGAFKMQSGDGNPFAYILTVPKTVTGGGAWDFSADPVRAPVRSAYDGLISGLAQRGATAAGLQLVRAALGQAMPQTFAETLLYGAGADIAAGIVDIRPGMVLRVEYEAYQYLGAASPYATYLNGYVGSSGATYETGSAFDANGRWLIGFDAFLAKMVQYMNVSAPVKVQGKQAGDGGIVDTFFANFRQPFLRIVYPAAFLGAGETGTPFPSYNIALLAAATLDQLNSATADLRVHRDQIDTAAVLYLRGRAMLSPCIRVWVNDESRVVPVGTTVGNLLEALGQRPPVLGLALSGLRFERATGPAITASSTALAVGAGVPVRFDWDKNIAYSPSVDWLTLPLLAGDRLWSDASC